jgi:hypothetical protein
LALCTCSLDDIGVSIRTLTAPGLAEHKRGRRDATPLKGDAGVGSTWRESRMEPLRPHHDRLSVSDSCP